MFNYRANGFSGRQNPPRLHVDLQEGGINFLHARLDFTVGWVLPTPSA